MLDPWVHAQCPSPDEHRRRSSPATGKVSGATPFSTQPTMMSDHLDNRRHQTTGKAVASAGRNKEAIIFLDVGITSQDTVVIVDAAVDGDRLIFHAVPVDRSWPRTCGGRIEVRVLGADDGVVLVDGGVEAALLPHLVGDSPAYRSRGLLHPVLGPGASEIARGDRVDSSRRLRRTQSRLPRYRAARCSALLAKPYHWNSPVSLRGPSQAALAMVAPPEVKADVTPSQSNSLPTTS